MKFTLFICIFLVCNSIAKPSPESLFVNQFIEEPKLDVKQQEGLGQIEIRNWRNENSPSITCGSGERCILYIQKKIRILNVDLSNLAASVHHFSAVKQISSLSTYFQIGHSVCNFHLLKWKFINSVEMGSLIACNN